MRIADAAAAMSVSSNRLYPAPPSRHVQTPSLKTSACRVREAARPAAERRWPFLPRAEGTELNLTFDDLLEFQYARGRDFVFLTVGAFDGLANDPLSRFVLTHDCRGVLIEPQPAVYARLRENFRDCPRGELLNAAVDAVSGSRELYYVAKSNGVLADWTEQIASFQLAHVRKHEAQAPGLTGHIRSQMVRTISFDDLLDQSASTSCRSTPREWMHSYWDGFHSHVCAQRFCTMRSRT